MKFSMTSVVVALLLQSSAAASDGGLRKKTTTQVESHGVKKTYPKKKTAPKKKKKTTTTGAAPKYDTLIVGGDEANVGEYPYYAEFWQTGCGGSLIASNIVLTAAHCASMTNEKVNIGAYKSGSTSNGAVQRTVFMERKHPRYNDNTVAYDFMLVKLNEPVEVDSDDNYVKIASSTPNVGTMLTVIGTGATSEGGDSSDTLLELDVPIVSTSRCQSEYTAEGDPIDESVMFCAGDFDGGVDSCQGDSGGPIVRKTNNGDIQIGVVSWGIGCARKDLPGVYAEVAVVTDWIEETACDVLGGVGGICPDAEDNNTGGGGGNNNGSCQDFLGWYDEDGKEYDCEWYADGSNCEDYGDDYPTNGVTANSACCECGGGSTSCTDFPGWYDEDGEEFDCEWYAQGDNCEAYGDSYENFGWTANEACCACQ